MKRQDLELGIQRLYYVVWALWLCFGVAALIHDNIRDVEGYAAVIGAFVIAPPALMFAVRWIYRGFSPKPRV